MKCPIWCSGLLVLLAMVGCNSSTTPTYPVQGRIEFEDGSPVRTGFIETYSHDLKINARGKINQDGTFTLSTFSEDDGAVVGMHDVIVTQFLGHEMAPQIKHDHAVEAVATKHADYATSGLSLTVEEQESNECVLTVSKSRR